MADTSLHSINEPKGTKPVENVPAQSNPSPPSPEADKVTPKTMEDVEGPVSINEPPGSEVLPDPAEHKPGTQTPEAPKGEPKDEPAPRGQPPQEHPGESDDPDDVEEEIEEAEDDGDVEVRHRGRAESKTLKKKK